jgi:hypothetical protein
MTTSGLIAAPIRRRNREIFLLAKILLLHGEGQNSLSFLTRFEVHFKLHVVVLRSNSYAIESIANQGTSSGSLAAERGLPVALSACEGHPRDWHPLHFLSKYFPPSVRLALPKNQNLLIVAWRRSLSVSMEQQILFEGHKGILVTRTQSYKVNDPKL